MRDPLKGWTREDATLADAFSIQQSAVGGTGLGLQVVEVVQAALTGQVVGVVDDGLDAQGSAVFEVLLDAGVLVEGVDGDIDAAGDDLGLERALRDRAAGAPVEDDLELLGAADVEVVGNEGFEEGSGVPGRGEHQGAGDLDLAQGDLPPVTVSSVVFGQRQRQN